MTILTVVAERYRKDRVIGAEVHRGISKTIHIMKAMLREIFDESAYERFLIRTHAARSVASYHAFLQEQEMHMARKARCC